MNRSRAISGRKNKPTWTEPAENSHTIHAADDIYKSINIRRIGILNEAHQSKIIDENGNVERKGRGWKRNGKKFQTYHKQYSNDSGWRFQWSEITVQWDSPWNGWHLDGICKISVWIPEIIIHIIIFYHFFSFSLHFIRVYIFFSFPPRFEWFIG